MNPRKPLRKVSLRRAREKRIYVKRKLVFLVENDHCFVCGRYVDSNARQLHHLRGRVGTLYLDERFWRMACQQCHAVIHEQPKWAIAHKFLGGAGEWNTPVKP